MICQLQERGLLSFITYPASTAIRGRSSAWGYLTITFGLDCPFSPFLYQFIDLSLIFAFHPYSTPSMAPTMQDTVCTRALSNRHQGLAFP
ncbi:hypothetical protein HBI88_030070 [Parastagonospora nodorum]|nr:hypothetical protein HBI88_030070 [Parastagonospora nodorum]